MVKYREDMPKWEKKLIASDNMDNVRRKNVLIPPPAKNAALPTKSPDMDRDMPHTIVCNSVSRTDL